MSQHDLDAALGIDAIANLAWEAGDDLNRSNVARTRYAGFLVYTQGWDASRAPNEVTAVIGNHTLTLVQAPAPGDLCRITLDRHDEAFDFLADAFHGPRVAAADVFLGFLDHISQSWIRRFSPHPSWRAYLRRVQP